MKLLWAPWRMKALLAAKLKREGCLFCKLLEKTDGPENLIVNRSQESFTIVNKYPYSSGHLMVIPIVHGDDITKISASVWSSIGRDIQKAVEILNIVYEPSGFNIGMNLGEAAGAGVVGHLHFHIVPRWTGDHNFIPIVGHTKVIPEMPEETYRRLKPYY